MSVESLEEWRKKLAERSASESPSTPNTGSEAAGLELTEDQLAATIRVFLVLQKARMAPFTTKSDFARMAANEVAICASEGLISNKIADTQYGNVWMITQEGMEQLEELDDYISTRH